MSRLRALRRAVGRTATISARRIRRRAPLVAGWSLREELLIGLIRAQFARREPVEKSRATLDALSELAPGLADWERLEVAGMQAAWVRPKDRSGRGVVLYLHGGAYGVGSIRSHRAMLERLADASGAALLAIEYRLAPEHPCPAAIEDVVAAWRWLLERVPPESVVLAGDSAGGGLVLTGLMAARDAGLPMPAGGVCISPWTDLTLSGASHRDNAPFDYLGESDIPGFAARYAGALPLDDPRVSPVFGDLTGLPPLLIQAGGAEVLLDDARMIAAAARRDGVRVQLDIWPGQVHVWHGFARVFPAGQRAIEAVGEWIGLTSAVGSATHRSGPR